jgi:ABC-type nitrate/sulfonate/bicarbonate transport system permease component
LWELLTIINLLPGRLLPPPSKILTTLVAVFLDGPLLYHTGQSLKRALAAYVLAALVAIPAGLVLGWFSRLYRMFEIPVEILRPIPAIALIPFGILVMGLGDFSKIFIITYASFFVLFIATLYGALNVDEVLLLSLRSLNATDSYIFRKVLIYAASPYIFAGLRQCIAVSLIVMVGVEMI